MSERTETLAAAYGIATRNVINAQEAEKAADETRRARENYLAACQLEARKALAALDRAEEEARVARLAHQRSMDDLRITRKESDIAAYNLRAALLTEEAK